MGYCFCDNCIHTLSGAVLPQELVDSNIEQERSDLNLRQMSNQMQQVLLTHSQEKANTLLILHAVSVSQEAELVVSSPDTYVLL